jgi:hypothetical protein
MYFERFPKSLAKRAHVDPVFFAHLDRPIVEFATARSSCFKQAFRRDAILVGRTGFDGV